MGIEASDAAVFLIALHWTVYIFPSNRAVGESGIYPYKYFTFAFYVLFPTLMASLAFFTKFPAYVDTGQYCYLPAKPWWELMSLSWIPRYLNLALIITMYCASYIYIRIKMRRFSRQSATLTTSHRERQIPDTPRLICHGLIPSPLESRRVSFRVPNSGGNMDEGTQVVQSDESIGFGDSLQSRLERISVNSTRPTAWPWQGLDWEGGVGQRALASGLVSPRTGGPGGMMEIVEPEHTIQPPRPSLSTVKLGGKIETFSSQPFLSVRPTTFNFYRRPISMNMEELEERSKGKGLNYVRSRHLRGQQMHIYTMLQQGPSPQNEVEPPPISPMVSLEYGTLESDGVSRGRDRIRRQLRLLFVFPAVYACVWIFPLINDVVGFHEDHKDPPYWILVASLVSLCIQGLANTVVFCLREKPWSHMRGGFWENMARFMSGLSLDSRNGIGRTREEMFHDGSRARLRREEEMEREARTSRLSPGGTSQASESRNWWDTELNNDDEGESQGGREEEDEWRVHDKGKSRCSTQTG
jgi:G protein-coupled receptor GPR1